MKQIISFNKSILLLAVVFSSYGTIAQSSVQTKIALQKEKIFAEIQKMQSVSSGTISRPGKVIHYNWNGLNNSWVPADTNWYSYNHSGQILSHTKKTANTYNSQKYTYLYNAKGDVLERLSFIWHGPTSQFQALFRESYAYNTNGHLVESFLEKYDTLSNSWELQDKRRNLITYNSQNKLTSYTIQIWDSLVSNWINTQRKINYIYNSSGNIQQFEVQNYNPNNQLWGNYSMDQYSYNAQNKPVECVVSNWTGSAYVNAIKFANLSWRYFDGSTFEGLINIMPLLYPNSKNQVSGYTLLGWNYPIPNNQWNNEFRFSTTFDLAGGSVLVTETYTNSAWKYEERISNNFDGYGNSTGTKYETWSSQQNNWMLDYELKYNHTYTTYLSQSVNQFCPSTAGCDNFEKFVYENYQVYSGLDDMPSAVSQCRIYPNPSNGPISVMIPENYLENDIRFELYDLLGNKVFSMDLENPVNELTIVQESGMYLYVISSGGSMYKSGKLLLEK
ncbi:MAG: T9SS type A sorting domain-containing protein [Bacteroidia bacterium]|nr:T9SS type A sorting domain-containing protein [Bacteroidia bacterium]